MNRIEWDLSRANHTRFIDFVRNRPSNTIPQECIQSSKDIWLEIGSGSGHFFGELARLNPEKLLIGIERDRFRGNRLVRKSQRETLNGIENFVGIRGNAIAAVVRDLPDQSVERVYILYPCPWPKNRHRLNRWYMHPIMDHVVRILKPGGVLIWASDQEFYVQEARFVCEQRYNFATLNHGRIQANPHNYFAHFPNGRTKFEQTFLSRGFPCFELVSLKKSPVNVIQAN